MRVSTRTLVVPHILINTLVKPETRVTWVWVCRTPNGVISYSLSPLSAQTIHPQHTETLRSMSKPGAVAPLPPGFTLPEPIVTGVPELSHADRGVEWLTSFDGLFVRQRIEWLESVSGCGTANSYDILPIRRGATLPVELSSAYMYPLRAMSDSLPLLHARERGPCLQRVCCPLTRGLMLAFANSTTESAAHAFTIERPCLCEPCCCWPLLFSRSQTLTVRDRSGELVAIASEPLHCCKACWTRTFVAADADGTPLYIIQASECGTHQGCNFCAPSCVNETYDVDVFTPDGEYVNSSTFVWPGCSCIGLTDRSNLLLQFPREADTTQRAALVGGMLLVEHTTMDVRGTCPPAANSTERLACSRLQAWSHVHLPNVTIFSPESATRFRR